MPSNLFVVVFPRKVQAHTVVVNRKEKPKSKWSVGGLRSPPGLLGRDAKSGKGDDKLAGLVNSGRDSASFGGGSPTSGSSSRDGSLARGGNSGSTSRSTAAQNEFHNQMTVRVQLSRPTEDMVPEADEKDSIGPGSQHLRADGSGTSWMSGHPGSSNALYRGGDFGSGSASAPGVSMSVRGPVSAAAGGGSSSPGESNRRVLKEHSKRRPFILIPSRSMDMSSNGGSGLLAEVLRDSDPNATVCAPVEGNGKDRSRSRSRNGSSDKHERSASLATSSWSSLGATRSSPGPGDDGPGSGSGGPGGGAPRGQRKEEAGASGGGGRLESGGADNGVTDGDAVAEESGSDSEEAEVLVGADSAGNGGVVVKESEAEKLEKHGGHEDQPDKVPANKEAEKKEKEKEGRGDQKANGEGPAGEGGGSAGGRGEASLSHGLEGVEVEGSSSLEGDKGERKDAQDDEDDEDGSVEWDGQKTPDRARQSMATAVSTPESKRRLVTEVIGDGDDVDVSRPQDMDEGETVDVEKLVRGIMVEMRGDQLLIGEPTYHISASGKLMTTIFPCDVEDAHLVLTRLESIGVGSETGSVNVLPMEIGRSDITRRRREDDSLNEDKARRARHQRATGGRFGDSSRSGNGRGGSADGGGGGGGGSGDKDKDDEAARRANERFRALASQIRVTQVTEEIMEGTKCHFDYMALLVASSAISAMGLATDNVAVVVAAMLVSPIMGPVLAFTFGTNVRDWRLAKKGFLVESFSLLICVVVGFIVGIVGVNFVEEDTWPTHEMETRGSAWGLLTGMCIAIPSGMAVALSILSKNVNSLVGVAISASLLPPAVNTGLCLAVALVGPAVRPFKIDVRDYVMIGIISMCLTIVNILSIYVAGVWLFIFKAVAPIKSENSFWSQDMIHARKFQQRLGKNGGEGGEAAHILRKNLLDAAKRHKDGGEANDGVDSGGLSDKFEFRASSSATNTHHRYWHKDRRRRPTIFDLFPDMGPEDGELSNEIAGGAAPMTPATVGGGGGGVRDSLKHAPAAARESLKLETGRLLGLLKDKFLDHTHKGDSSSNAQSNGNGSSNTHLPEEQ